MITLTGGGFQNPSSIFVPNGSVTFQLNVDATVIAAPGGFVCAAIPVTFQLDGNGNLVSGSQLWSNAELEPQNSIGLGTYYLVTVYDQNGARLNAVPMWWQFPEAANSSVDISKIVPISTVGGNVIFYPTSFLSGVASVTFTGDGTVLSSTPSLPVTSTGTLTATLKTQTANTIFAGPTSGPIAAPTFRSLVLADLPSGYNIWSSLIAATQDLVLANTTFNTTFSQTSSSVNWLWSNVNPATAFTAQHNSPKLNLAGTYWTGAASAADTWTIQDVLSTNTPTDTISLSALTISHVGTPTVAQILLPPGNTSGGNIFPGIAFNNDVSIGFYNLGSAQLSVIAGYSIVASFGSSGSGVFTLGPNVPIVGNGAQGFLYATVMPSAQSAISFNIPAGYPGSPTMTAIILTHLASDPTITSFAAAQEGAMWYDTTNHVVKYYNGSAIKTVATV